LESFLELLTIISIHRKQRNVSHKYEISHIQQIAFDDCVSLEIEVKNEEYHHNDWIEEEENSFSKVQEFGRFLFGPD